MKYQARKKALVLLADGTIFYGKSIGIEGTSTGEICFNTGMTGYQEILTDPSYAEQIITLTYPHIGNYGTNSEDEENDTIWAKGLVIRDLPLLASNFRSEQDLSSYLKAKNVVAIADIDTRKLTRILRDKGAQKGCIVTLAEFNEQAETKALEDAVTGTTLGGGAAEEIVVGGVSEKTVGVCCGTLGGVESGC